MYELVVRKVHQVYLYPTTILTGLATLLWETKHQQLRRGS